MRISYTPNPPSTNSSDEEAILSRVLERRGGKLIPLDLTFLHAPQITDGFNSFMSAIRTKNSLPPDVRELAFCRVAALTGAWYEWVIHAPIAQHAGISVAALEGIKHSDVPLSGISGLDEIQMAVLRYTDAMTLNATVSDEVFNRVRGYFNDKEIVELTASIAGFNTVSRFCVALDVGEMNANT